MNKKIEYLVLQGALKKKRSKINNYDFNQFVQEIGQINENEREDSIIYLFIALANQGLKYKELDKLHYTIHEVYPELEICFWNQYQESIKDAMFCPKCGNYIGHPVAHFDCWMVSTKNIPGHEIKYYWTYTNFPTGCVCDWTNDIPIIENEELKEG